MKSTLPTSSPRWRHRQRPPAAGRSAATSNELSPGLVAGVGGSDPTADVLGASSAFVGAGAVIDAAGLSVTTQSSDSANADGEAFGTGIVTGIATDVEADVNGERQCLYRRRERVRRHHRLRRRDRHRDRQQWPLAAESAAGPLRQRGQQLRRDCRRLDHSACQHRERDQGVPGRRDCHGGRRQRVGPGDRPGHFEHLRAGVWRPLCQPKQQQSRHGEPGGGRLHSKRPAPDLRERERQRRLPERRCRPAERATAWAS